MNETCQKGWLVDKRFLLLKLLHQQSLLPSAVIVHALHVRHIFYSAKFGLLHLVSSSKKYPYSPNWKGKPECSEENMNNNQNFQVDEPLTTGEMDIFCSSAIS